MRERGYLLFSLHFLLTTAPPPPSQPPRFILERSEGGDEVVEWSKYVSLGRRQRKGENDYCSSFFSILYLTRNLKQNKIRANALNQTTSASRYQLLSLGRASALR